MLLTQSHVLLTGASRGIGQAIARDVARRGARLTLVARSAGLLEHLASDLKGHALAADLADPEQRRDLVARAEQVAGPVDVLVNVAGVDAVGSTLVMDAESMAELFQVNLLAPAELCRQVLPGMLHRGRGHLVNISSGFSTITSPGLSSYCASKAGLSHYTAGLRSELRGTSVGTTLVELGPVRTAMYAGIQQDRLAGPALARLVRLRAAVEVDVDTVARQVAEAVKSGRRHVVVPKRMVPVVSMTWLPRRAAELLLTGLPKR